MVWGRWKFPSCSIRVPGCLGRSFPTICSAHSCTPLALLLGRADWPGCGQLVVRWQACGAPASPHAAHTLGLLPLLLTRSSARGGMSVPGSTHGNESAFLHISVPVPPRCFWQSFLLTESACVLWPPRAIQESGGLVCCLPLTLARGGRQVEQWSGQPVTYLLVFALSRVRSLLGENMVTFGVLACCLNNILWAWLLELWILLNWWHAFSVVCVWEKSSRWIWMLHWSLWKLCFFSISILYNCVMVIVWIK